MAHGQLSASWCYDRAKRELDDALVLHGSQSLPENALLHAHMAVEFALKAALIHTALWDGRSNDLKTHYLADLIDELIRGGGAFPGTLEQDLRAISEVPRQGEGPCEASTQVRYAENLDMGALSPSHWIEVASQTIAHVGAAYGF